jgi:hypothetical protein
MSSKNGGFPPIKYCDNINEEQKNQIKNNTPQKERFFTPKISNNINIRKILKENISKPIIDLDNKPETLDIINEI